MRRGTHAIPPSMYRHFALVTVVLTALLALFAQGESAEGTRAAAASSAPAAQPSPGLKLATAPDGSAAGGWGSDGGGGGSDFNADFGQPMDDLLGDSSGSFPGEDLAQEAGYSSEYLASLNPKERELLLKGLQENGMLEPEIRSGRSSELIAASGRRSGAAGVED